MQSAECRVQNAECRVQSAECRMQSAECRVQSEFLLQNLGLDQNLGLELKGKQKWQITEEEEYTTR